MLVRFETTNKELVTLLLLGLTYVRPARETIRGKRSVKMNY